MILYASGNKQGNDARGSCYLLCDAAAKANCFACAAPLPNPDEALFAGGVTIGAATPQQQSMVVSQEPAVSGGPRRGDLAWTISPSRAGSGELIRAGSRRR
jgi:hypothetical protein